MVASGQLDLPSTLKSEISKSVRSLQCLNVGSNKQSHQLVPNKMHLRPEPDLRARLTLAPHLSSLSIK